LSYLYNKFKNSGLQKKTLKLIKENLIWRSSHISAIIEF
jgi:hypothetical protein